MCDNKYGIYAGGARNIRTHLKTINTSVQVYCEAGAKVIMAVDVIYVQARQ